jgi:Outer membrane protein beta-barrel domain
VKYLFLFISLISIQTINAQIKTGVRGYYGRSTVLNEMESVRPPLDKYVTAYDHNFGGGVYLQYGFNDWFGLETSLIFEQIRTYEGYFVKTDTTNWNADVIEFDENGLADYWSSEEWVSTNYLSVPLGVEFRFNRFRLGLGGQFSYLLKAGGASNTWALFGGDDYNDFGWADGFYFHRRHNITAYAMVGFNILENLSLEVKFIEGLTDISQELWSHSKFWTRQFQFGLSYEIWPREKKEKLEEGSDVNSLEIPSH